MCGQKFYFSDLELLASTSKVEVEVHKSEFTLKMQFPSNHGLVSAIKTYPGHPQWYDPELKRLIVGKCSHLVDELSGRCLECEIYRDLSVTNVS